VVCYNTTGVTQWVGGTQGDASGSSTVHALAVNSSQTYVYPIGRLGAGSQYWASYPATSSPAFTAPQARSPFVAKLDLVTVAGTSSWVTTTTAGSGPAEAWAVAPGTTGTMNVAGTQPGTTGVNWGYGLVTSGQGSGDNPLLFQVFD
jgi:hypothetical protein